MTVLDLRNPDQRAEGVSRTLAEAHADLSVALAELRGKRGNIDRMWLYHEGEHPQVWMTPQVRDALGLAFSQNGLQDNYCELAVEAAVQRLGVIGWTGPGAQAAEQAWADNALDLDQEELYRGAGIAGEAFVIVWRRDDGTFEVAVNDARNVHVEYGSSRRTDRKWGAKVWAEQIDSRRWRWRANIYYRPDLPGPGGTAHPGELVRLVGKVTTGKRPAEMPAKAADFTFDPDDPGGGHDFDACPVVRFAHMRKRRSRLRKIVPIQDKINKLGANKMVTAEYLAFPWAYALTADPKFTGDKARRWPGSMLVLDPGGPAADGDNGLEGDGGSAPTQVGQFDAAQLDNYDRSIQAEVEKLFTIAPLPRHMMVNPGTAPSGDAITADEGPFLASVLDLAQMYGASWRDIAELMGLDAEVVWGDPAFRSLAVLAAAILALVNAGMPLEVALERYARWTGEELDALRAAVTEAQARAETAGAAALRAADQGGDPAELLDRAGLLGDGSPADRVEAMTMQQRVDAVVKLVGEGWDAGSAAEAFGLPPGLVYNGKPTPPAMPVGA